MVLPKPADVDWRWIISDYKPRLTLVDVSPCSSPSGLWCAALTSSWRRTWKWRSDLCPATLASDPRPFWQHRPPVGGAGSPGGQAEGPSQPSLGDESRGVRTRAKRRLCRSRSETSDSAWASRWPRCSSHQTTQTTQFFPPSSAASSAHSGKWRVYTCPSGWGGGAKFSINENKCDELENKSALRIFSPLLWLDSKKKTLRSYLSTILWLFTFKNGHNSQILAHRQLSLACRVILH